MKTVPAFSSSETYGTLDKKVACTTYQVEYYPVPLNSAEWYHQTVPCYHVPGTRIRLLLVLISSSSECEMLVLLPSFLKAASILVFYPGNLRN